MSDNSSVVVEDPSLNCASLKVANCEFTLDSTDFQELLESISLGQDRKQEIVMRPGLKKHNEVQTVKERESVPTSSWLIAVKDEGKLNEQAPEMHSSQVEVGHRRCDKAIEVVGRDMNKEVLENSDFRSGTAGEGLQKLTGNHDVDQLTADNGASGSSKCSLKIEVIDGTALIDLSNVANHGYSKKTCLDIKHQKKRVREGIDYHKTEAPDNCQRKGKLGKLIYTKKDMEAMRFLNVKEQKKLWQQICNGLEPSIRKEYVELGSFRQQRNGHVDSRHTAAMSNNFHSVLGLAAAQRGGNYVNNFVY